jgi:hypothetical protein
MGNAYSTLVGKSDWKKPLGRYRHMWEKYTEMGLKE